MNKTVENSSELKNLTVRVTLDMPSGKFNMVSRSLESVRAKENNFKIILL